MATGADSSSATLFSLKNTRPPEDTVFYSIYPDSSTSSSSSTDATAELQSLHLQILQNVSPFTDTYTWQHQPFTLSTTPTPIPRLSGHLRFGDNVEDEWFVVFLLFHISKTFHSLSISVHDTDGDFLLIETAFHLPKWINPETSVNRVFIRRGLLHIIPESCYPTTPILEDSLRFLIKNDSVSVTHAPDSVQLHLSRKLGEYPERAYKNVHRVRVSVPVSVAWVLKHEPSFVSLAVEGFYDRDIDSMKYAARMERFLRREKEEEMVEIFVRMSRAMYAQLMQQKFQAPSCYPMPERGNVGKYMEAELGMKIACGFEMMYQLRKKEGEEGKGETWEAFKDSLERSGYFEGLLAGSKEYKRLMESAEAYYRSSSLHARASEVLNTPVKRIEDILALPHSCDNFKHQELPPSDDDSWLYGGEEELNAALQERQQEMDAYDLKHKKKHKSKEQQDVGSSSAKDFNEFDLGDIAKSMQAFVKSISSFEGAEIHEDRNVNDVNLDADQFMRDLESIMRPRGSEDNGSDHDLEGGSSSDLDFDENEDDSELSEGEEEGDAFIRSYSDTLNKELKATTLNNTFVLAQNERSSANRDEGISTEDMDELTAVDVDINLVQNLLNSYSSQEGMPGPASNLLGLMGLRLPEDTANPKSVMN